MSGSADLVVRILADTGNAEGNVNALISTMGKLAGVGAGAGVAGGIVEASMKVQDAMAKVQTAYNSVDFAPGTQKYQNAQDTIQRLSQTTATSFSETAAVFAQGARFIDEAGQRLPTDKLNEYTDTMIRLSKVSSDGLSPEAIGQQSDILAKLFGTSDFNKLGSEVSALSGMHNQGEGPGLDAAIAIGQVGADIGVSQEQALAVGNYMADLGLGGQMGGSSIGRLLQRMNMGADTALNPEEQYSQVKKQRDASEKASDLQDQLAIAEQRRAQMFGQHGLKTAYKRDPAAMMAADQQIAKLQREIGDTQQDNAHLNDAAPGSSKGSANIGAMAKLVGEDQSTFAQQFQSDPMGALLQWTGKLSQLPENERMAQVTKAFGGRGSVNVRDQKIIEALANPDRQGSLQDYLDTAQAQANDPTDLATRSAIPLGTTSSKVTNVANEAYGAAAAAGNGPRQGIDMLAQKVLDNTGAIDKLDQTLAGNALTGTIATGVISGVTAALPIALSKALTGGGSAGAGGAGAGAGAGGALAGAAGAAAPSLMSVLVPAAVAAVAAYMGGTALVDKGVLPSGGNAPDPHAAFSNPHLPFAGLHPPSIHDAMTTDGNGSHISVDLGGIVVQAQHTAQSAEEIGQRIKNEFIAAWNAAAASQPVPGQLGGLVNTTGQGPR